MRILSTLMLVTFAAITLVACESTGNSEMAVPYERERTAVSTPKVMAPPPVVQECPPMPEPKVCEVCKVCETCEDTSPLKSRIYELENALRLCQEKTQRVQETYRETLTK